MTQVLGEVASPGIYKFVPGKRVNDYIAGAGNYTIDAEKKEVWITFPNGTSKQYNRWLSNPKVKDGSVITVGLKKEEEPFNVTEFTKEVASIAADLTTLVVFISIINN